MTIHEQEKRVALTMQERVAKAGAARSAHARRRRFERYADEMAAHPDQVPADLVAAIVHGLRTAGWTVTAPVGEREGRATTQPSGR